MPGARWFCGSRLNFAENLLRRRRDDADALVFRGEDGISRRLSFAELYKVVATPTGRHPAPAGRTARRPCGRFHAQSAADGDCHAGDNQHWRGVVVVFAGFRHRGVCSTVSARSRRKYLFAADGYVYAGKQIDSLQRIAAIAAQLLQPAEADRGALSAARAQYRRPAPCRVVGRLPGSQGQRNRVCPAAVLTIRCTSCIRPAPPACRKCIVHSAVAPCCST